MRYHLPAPDHRTAAVARHPGVETPGVETPGVETPGVETPGVETLVRAVAGMLCIFMIAAGCSDSGNSSAPPLLSLPAAASVAAAVEVPQQLTAPPFDVRRVLLVPPGFGIRVWARVPNARFMALAPNGDVLVSVPSEGRIVLLRTGPGPGTLPQVFDFATGLRNPHDMVFHTVDDTVYLYFAESNRVSRVAYQPGMTQIGAREIVVDGLPDSSTPELRGAYGHELKNIALAPDDKLYVSIGSSCNACVDDTLAAPVRGAIYQYGADGRNGRLFARGLRNAEGLDILPGTGVLWAAVNNRDQIRVPLNIDVDHDGSNDLGKLIPSYVDDNPPELFTAVRDGGNYGWPFCNQAQNAAALSDLLFDFENNPGGAAFDCASADRPLRTMPSHAAPLGFSFLHNTGVPAAYRKGAVIAQHGCWNCTTLKAGYKVVYFPFDDAGNAGAEMDLVSGFVTDAAARAVWGRPVDVIADAQGNILISDDYAGAIYQLFPK